ncbi:MAG: protein-export chaperone SecB [Gammaproteobacteria bacterium RIFCSPHIGHO2_12_FULL_37_34]|nr:MAG: protein-export chaperone SecB [Gammaproteobacteria bacterium RIFCSPHIGHO2_12_FULL_37_34]
MQAKTEKVAENSTEKTGQHPLFEIQRIFVKDISFEAPNTPHTFVEEWKPEVALNLETKSTRIQENLHEVILSITATVMSNKKTAFLVEVDQAGVFVVSGFPNDQLHHMLGSFCPNVLFPYAREVVSDIVVRGGFPQLILAPVNFDALYNKHMEEQGGAGAGQKSN